MMIFGSDLLVRIVVSLPIPPVFVAILAVAVGTSIPELMVSITSLRKGYYNIMIGNIIGSVIANTLLVMGIGAAISPVVFSTKLILFCALMVLINLLFVVFLRRGYEINRKEGIVLLLSYLCFTALSVVYLM